MSTSTDFLAEVKRDRWGRPLILQPDGSSVGYTRASTLAKTLDDQSNLTKWMGRMTALGMARSPHLLTEAQGLDATCDDPVTEHKGKLDSIVDRAKESAGGSRAASIGTALHAWTEAWIKGRDPQVPADWKPHFDAQVSALSQAGLTCLETELFVVNDALQSAGTTDMVLRLPDGRVALGDVKTGAHDPTYPLGVTTQLAIYSGGQRYDAGTGQRAPIHPDLDPSLGILIHLPAKASPPVCTLYRLDLAVGAYLAALSAQVRRVRRAKPITPW